MFEKRGQNRGWFLVLGFSLLPIVLWFMNPSSEPRFSNFTIAMSNVGQILALVGTAMFAINLMLSTRLKFIEKLFFGLNRVYYRHSHLGQLAFILILFHPLLLLPKYAGGSFTQAASFLLPINNLAINLGWFALVGMIVLILITLYLPFKYNFWKVTHKFLGFFFFLAALHVWFIPSDVSSNLPLRVYIIGISLIGLVAYTYYTLLGKFFVKKFPYTVLEVKSLNQDIVQIVMEPRAKPLEFSPGQFVFVSFNDQKVSRESHPFSITSSPDEQNVSITTKKLGDYTNKLDKLSVGAQVTLEGPYGVFSYTVTSNNHQIWIAGGIGITPFVSMARSLSESDRYNVDLYYCVRNEKEAVYLNDLKALPVCQSGDLKIIPFFSDESGYINADWIENNSGNLSNKKILICAPPPMIKALKSQFFAKGVSKPAVLSEEFSY